MNAADEAALRAAASAYANLDHPEGTIAPGIAHEQVASWLAERYDWRHLDDRITDLGWMFLVNTQPDEQRFHEELFHAGHPLNPGEAHAWLVPPSRPSPS